MKLKRLGANKWQLLEPWSYSNLNVPEGFITDGASVPRLFAGGDVVQLTVGTSGANVTVSSTSYTAGGTSSITALTITQPAA
jgi:hypothetical protein